MKGLVFTAILSSFFMMCLTVDENVYNINDFQRTYFHIINKKSNFYKVNTGLKNNSTQDILATGYISKDVNVDIIMIDRESQQLTFMIYNDSGHGNFDQELNIDIEKKNKDEKILNVHFITLADEERNSIVIISKYKDTESGKDNVYIMLDAHFQHLKKLDKKV